MIFIERIDSYPFPLLSIPMIKTLKLTIIFAILGLVIAVQGQEATPEATENALNPLFVVEGDGVALELYFGNLQQGRAALLGLRGEGIEAAQANVFNRDVDFFQLPEREGWWAVIAAEMGQSMRQYDLTVSIDMADTNSPQVLLARFDVISGGFLTQNVTLNFTPELSALLDEEVEATELAQILELASPVTETPLWDAEGFGWPVNGEITSPFGAVRVFNGYFNTVHTGWDFQVGTGVPVLASAAGEVAFAGALPIRGNYVLINHGQGIYTGYAHMSVTYVTQGQTISREQILGHVGTTGRSSSAHAHFETLVTGIWVDPVDFVRMNLP
jgi:murein DD-endopeptidase MepM/ murein hydrolase activator NlpD